MHAAVARLSFAAVYYADTAAALRLAGLTAKYVLATLSARTVWLLDQSSLFCASRYLQQRDPDFSINDFGSDPGVNFYAAIEVAGGSEEKQDLRSAARPAAAPQPAST